MVYSTYKNGYDWGMVYYCVTHISFFFCNFVDDIVGIINIYMEDYGRILRTFNGSMIKLFLAENKPPKFDINIFPKHLGGITHVQT